MTAPWASVEDLAKEVSATKRYRQIEHGTRHVHGLLEPFHSEPGFGVASVNGHEHPILSTLLRELA